MSCLEAGGLELEWRLRNATKVPSIFSLQLLACTLAVPQGLGMAAGAAAPDTY